MIQTAHELQMLSSMTMGISSVCRHQQLHLSDINKQTKKQTNEQTCPLQYTSYAMIEYSLSSKTNRSDCLDI